MVTQGAPRRILLIKPSSLGDIVHALPVLAAIRRTWPTAHVAWLVANAFAPLLDNHPLIDEVIRFDRTRYGRMLTNPAAFAAFLRFVGELRRRRFDLVVDLQGLVRTGFFSLTSGAKRRVGFRHAREFAWMFYSQRVRVPTGRTHAVDQNLALARAMGLDTDANGTDPAVEFPLGLREAEVDAARQRLRTLFPDVAAHTNAAGQPDAPGFIAVIPGARWVTKQWRADRIAATLDRFHDAGLPRCVLLGAPSDREFTAQITAAMKTPCVDLVGQTNLRELTALLSLTTLVLTHDSGPMHIAAALKRPIVAIFGPTDPQRCGPYETRHRVVATPIECSPCYRRTCSHHSCMEQLAVDTVERTVREMLGMERDASAQHVALPVRT